MPLRNRRGSTPHYPTDSPVLVSQIVFPCGATLVLQLSSRGERSIPDSDYGRADRYISDLTHFVRAAVDSGTKTSAALVSGFDTE